MVILLCVFGLAAFWLAGKLCAGILWTANVPTSGGIAMVTNTAIKTILQINTPTNQRIKVNEWDIAFNGTSNTAAPILVELVRQTSAGTGGNALTLIKLNNSDQETLQTSGQYGPTTTIWTTEPTDSSIIPFCEFVHPQQGYAWRARFGNDLQVQGGTRLGLRVTAAASVNVTARLAAEE
jgi:hypothetical protein